MPKITLAVTALTVLGIVFVATVASRSVESSLAEPKRNSAAPMLIDDMMIGAKNLPVQSFNAF